MANNNGPTKVISEVQFNDLVRVWGGQDKGWIAVPRFPPLPPAIYGFCISCRRAIRNIGEPSWCSICGPAPS